MLKIIDFFLNRTIKLDEVLYNIIYSMYYSRTSLLDNVQKYHSIYIEVLMKREILRR